MPGTDWLDWHREYQDPGSPLSRRRLVVQGFLRSSLTDLAGVPIRLLSLCAGDGSDVLEVLASLRPAPSVQALLVELDAELADRAGRLAEQLDLGPATVRTLVADAAQVAGYAEQLPVDILVACGVFGNIDEADTRRTIAALPAMVRPGGRLIWTRSKGNGEGDASSFIRQLLAEQGFGELGFVPDESGWRVGLHRFDGTPKDADLPAQLFRFIR